MIRRVLGRLAAKVRSRAILATIAHDVDVVGEVPSFQRTVQIPWEEAEQHRERKTEPVVGRSEDEVVVAPRWCNEPAWRNHVVDGLSLDVSEL